MDISLLVSTFQGIITLCISAAAFYYARKKDTVDNTKEFAEMTAELRIMRRDINEMNQNLKVMREDREEDHDQIVKISTQMEKMWFYIDHFKEKLEIK